MSVSWARVFIACVVMLGSTGCATYDTMSARFFHPEKKTETMYSVARLQERQGNLRDAQRLYEDILKRDPKHVASCHRLAAIATRYGEHEAAEHYFKRALEIAPNNVEVLTDYGYFVFLQNDLPRAETYIRQALQESPKHPRALNNLAIVLGHGGKIDESYNLFRQVVSEAEAHANVAYIHVQRGEGDLAMERYSRALSLDSNLKHASHALVQISELKLKHERAAIAAAAPAAQPAKAAAPEPVITPQPVAPVAVVQQPAAPVAVVQEPVAQVSAEEAAPRFEDVFEEEVPVVRAQTKLQETWDDEYQPEFRRESVSLPKMAGVPDVPAFAEMPRISEQPLPATRHRMISTEMVFTAEDETVGTARVDDDWIDFEDGWEAEETASSIQLLGEEQSSMPARVPTKG